MTTPIGLMIGVGILNLTASLAMQPSGLRVLGFLSGIGLIGYGVFLVV